MGVVDGSLGSGDRRLLQGSRSYYPLDETRRLVGDGYFDYEASDTYGLAAAWEAKLYPSGGVYLEFRPF